MSGGVELPRDDALIDAVARASWNSHGGGDEWGDLVLKAGLSETYARSLKFARREAAAAIEVVRAHDASELLSLRAEVARLTATLEAEREGSARLREALQAGASRLTEFDPRGKLLLALLDGLRAALAPQAAS